MPAIAVTGASGLVGGEIVRRFAARGWRVLALVRDPATPLPPGAEPLAYQLAVAAPDLSGIDCAVHAAYVPGEVTVNVEGSRRLASSGADHTVFISSMSAHCGGVSAYARQKLASEPFFDAVLRPGLVLGDGGLLRDTVRFMRRYRVVPLIGGGRQPLQPVGLDDLVTAVERVVDGRLTGSFTIADPSETTYAAVYRRIARALGLRVLFVPVPYGAVRVGLRAARVARLPLGVGEENLRGIRAARHVDTTADLERLGLRLEPLETVVRRRLAPG